MLHTVPQIYCCSFQSEADKWPNLYLSMLICWLAILFCWLYIFRVSMECSFSQWASRKFTEEWCKNFAPWDPPAPWKTLQLLIHSPSSRSTSFCSFWTDLSANSARASAWGRIQGRGNGEIDWEGGGEENENEILAEVQQRSQMTGICGVNKMA